MKLEKIIIHNIRSFKDAEFITPAYTLLVGENNSGKTNLLYALRLFYEEGNVKFKNADDFPKFATADNESWVELEFITTNEEQESLREEYRSTDNKLKVRKYFKSDNEAFLQKDQSNIYAYENGTLSNNLFYGARNISQAKLGSVIYIPAVSKSDDTLKLSGPSPFRDLVNTVMKKVVEQSPSFQNLETAFTNFNTDFRNEADQAGMSISSLTNEINDNIEDWGINFGVDIRSIKPDDIVKSLLQHYFKDQQLNDEEINHNSFGQGLQRHLIYTLIRLAAKYKSATASRTRGFNPDYSLILFEEPEAFLHPTQQEKLQSSLRELSQLPNQQIILSTHSPKFVCKQTLYFNTLIRLGKSNGVTKIFKLDDEEISFIQNENIGLYNLFCEKLMDTSTPQAIKTIIQRRQFGHNPPRTEDKLQDESINYFIWLNAERSSLFFAKHVIICEGPSEKVLFEYLFNELWTDLRDKQIYILDALGKFNIHRYISFLSKLGIEHSIFADKDNDDNIHAIINDYITSKRTAFTKNIHFFENDIEDFLEIAKPSRKDLKPINIIKKQMSGEITTAKITALKNIILSFI